MVLIVGLGNPGTNYSNTRHNLGADWVTNLCNRHNVLLQNNNKLNAKLAFINNDIYCMISNSYMNHSGFSIEKFFRYYKIIIDDLLVVHDDLDLNIGDIRLKLSGGHGGHNGLRHIIEQLQTNNFKRLRIGIGHPKIKDQVTDYVLGTFSKQEKLLINRAVENSWQIIPDIFAKNWQKIMQFLSASKPCIGDL